MHKLVSIVPGLHPAINGVGDYALNLALQLRQDFNVNTHFIVANPTWKGNTEVEGFLISQVSDPSPAALLSILTEESFDRVLLHYVGYGYAKRGCPLWLVQGLQQWKKSYPDRYLIAMFHEVAAFGPPWTSSFWLSGIQKNLARTLAIISNSCVVNKQQYGDWLEQLSGRKLDINCFPVFSNIGEPKFLLPLHKRSRKLVVFGSRNSRLQVYERCLPSITEVCQILDIQEIIDIGVPTDIKMKEINKIPIREQGLCEALKVSQIMQDSIAGFLNFPPPLYLAKSGIFASYCAHQLIPCMVEYHSQPVDALESGKHYWSHNHSSPQLSLAQGQRIANSAHNWYQNHSLPNQAKFFYQKLF